VICIGGRTGRAAPHRGTAISAPHVLWPPGGALCCSQGQEVAQEMAKQKAASAIARAGQAVREKKAQAGCHAARLASAEVRAAALNPEP
jgi:hypothetical protein